MNVAWDRREIESALYVYLFVVSYWAHRDRASVDLCSTSFRLQLSSELGTVGYSMPRGVRKIELKQSTFRASKVSIRIETSGRAVLLTIGLRIILIRVDLGGFPWFMEEADINVHISDR